MHRSVGRIWRFIERNTAAAGLTSVVFLSIVSCTARVPTSNVQSSTILGAIDGIIGEPGAQYVQGWACVPDNQNPLTVQIFTGGAQGAGQLYRSYVANAAPHDSIVANACGPGAGHRFSIGVSGDLLSRAGQPIYIYATTSGGGSQKQLDGSGSYSVPASTTMGQVQSIDASGNAIGWAVDVSQSSASILVAVYADGDTAMGAETGTLVWEGPANQAISSIGMPNGVTGNHGFRVQLPAWVTQGVHSLSVYAVNIEGRIDAPLANSPAVPGASTIVSQISSTTSVEGFPTWWQGYNLPPGQTSFVGLRGTVSVENTAGIYGEILFLVSYLPSGPCLTEGAEFPSWPETQNQLVMLWTNIIKSPTTGVFSAPVDFTLPKGIPISNCLVIEINGGTVALPHPVTSTVNLVATYTPNVDQSTQILEFENEFCFGQDWGCEGATANDTQSFAAVTQVTQRSRLDAILGNVSDSTFDGSKYFAPLPTGPWTAINDIYVYRQSDCSQFPTAARSWNGPGDYFSQIPQDAMLLVSAPLSGNGGVGEGESINYLMPGMTNGVSVYQTFSDIVLNPGDCLVSLYGVQGTTGGFDNEDQLQAIVTTF